MGRLAFVAIAPKSVQDIVATAGPFQDKSDSYRLRGAQIMVFLAAPRTRDECANWREWDWWHCRRAAAPA
ncbi:MAG: hypothetical protein ACFCBU_19125, partial [Cyanophyceae cyanobacterium]